MSTEQEGAPEAAADKKQQVPPEFLERLNQFIRLANRMERKRDSQYATFVFMNAFARYSAHHYISRVQNDSPEERASYIDYIARSFADMAEQNIEQLTQFNKAVAEHREANRIAREAAGNADAAGAE